MNAQRTGDPTRSRYDRDGGGRRSGVISNHPAIARLVGVAAAVVLLSACGSSATGSGSNSSSSGSLVKVGTATVSGSSEQVLTETSGWTLYYNTNDTPTTASCTGACAGTWPPLLLSSGQPTSASSLPETLTTASTGNGSQVEYDGHPLYRYSGDSGADQSNGEGIEGIWFVATSSLGSSSSTASPSAAAVPPNGY